MLDDNEILAGTIVSPDGMCTFTLPDGHKIQRQEQPATGRDTIEWCEGVREIDMGRQLARKEEQTRAKKERKERERRDMQRPTVLVPIPPGGVKPVQPLSDPFVAEVIRPDDPYEYALGMLNTNQETLLRLATTISELILEEQRVRDVVAQWATIVETIEEPSNETGTEAVDIVSGEDDREPEAETPVSTSE